MTTLERHGQIAVGIAFTALLAVIIALSSAIGDAKADVEPFACTLVADSDEAFRHAVAEARFYTLPEWEWRNPGFRRDFSDGVDVKMSNVYTGYITHRTITISDEAEYKAARRAQPHRYFLNQAAETLILPTGDEIALNDSGSSAVHATGGANVRYWFYTGLEPTDDTIWCYEIRGRGHPPTPTPTPEGGE